MNVRVELMWIGIHCLCLALMVGPQTRGPYWMVLSLINGGLIGGGIGMLVHAWFKYQRVAAQEWKE